MYASFSQALFVPFGPALREISFPSQCHGWGACAIGGMWGHRHSAKRRFGLIFGLDATPDTLTRHCRFLQWIACAADGLHNGVATAFGTRHSMVVCIVARSPPWLDDSVLPAGLFRAATVPCLHH